MLNEIFEHEQNFHHKIQEILPSSLILWLKVLDVLTEMLRGHESEERHHVGHYSRGVSVALVSVSVTQGCPCPTWSLFFLSLLVFSLFLSVRSLYVWHIFSNSICYKYDIRWVSM